MYELLEKARDLIDNRWVTGAVGELADILDRIDNLHDAEIDSAWNDGYAEGCEDGYEDGLADAE